MSDKKYDNSGALFKNARKEKDTHADYEGSATIDGREYWLSSWIKKGAKGTFMSIAFKPKDAPKAAQKPRKFLDHDERDEADVPF